MPETIKRFVLYLDWCDFQKLKSTKESGSPMWDFILEQWDELLIPYSDYHLSDLYPSQSEFHEADLEFIDYLTKGYHCRYIPQKHQIQFDSVDPKERFQIISRVRKALENFSYLAYATEDEIQKQELLFRERLDLFCIHQGKGKLSDQEIIEVLHEGAKTNDFIKEFFKLTLHENNLSLVMEDAERFWLEAISYGHNYKLMRKTITQLGGNVDQILALEGLGAHLKKHILNNSDLDSSEIPIPGVLQGQGWGTSYQSKFLGYYFGLDVTGQHPEKMKKKKANLHNLYNDFGHTFLGTHMFDYITGDKDNREKAKLCIKKFNLSSSVWSLKEFAEWVTS